jgi:hypothetical protein
LAGPEVAVAQKPTSPALACRTGRPRSVSRYVGDDRSPNAAGRRLAKLSSALHVSTPLITSPLLSRLIIFDSINLIEDVLA